MPWQGKGISRLESSFGQNAREIIPALTGHCEGHCKGLGEEGAACLEVLAFLMAGGQREMMWLPLTRAHSTWRNLLSEDTGQGGHECWPVINCLQPYSTQNEHVQGKQGYSCQSYELLVGYRCDDLILIYDLAETGQDKSISGRKG